MTLLDKVKWVFGIAMVFLLVLATNLIDRQNFMRIENSIETIYADRILAQDIIYHLTRQINQKQTDYLTAAPGEIQDRETVRNVRIKEHLELFSATRLTPKEEIIFSRLKQVFADLRAAESSTQEAGKTQARFQQHLTTFQGHLDELAEIQVREGKRELHESRKALSSANLFTRLEIGALIVMALLVQIIILYTPGADS